MPTLRSRRLRRLAAVTAVIGAAALTGAPADSAGAAAIGSTIRVAHFSPDTPRMDVYAAGFDGQEALVLPKLGFGEVSLYMNLPAGTYAFSMRPQGAPATSAAALRVSADLEEGGIYTFAAFGRTAELQTELLTDDMAAPGAAQARVRIIQAAGDVGPVDVRTSAAPLFSNGTRLGSVGSYVSVPAGPVDVSAMADGVDPAKVSVDPAAGTVSSLVVLDQPPTGGLQVVSVTDGTGTPGGAATPTGMPVGGVDTGRGGTAAGDRGPGGLRLAATAAGGLTAVAAAAWFASVLTDRRTRRHLS